MKIEHIAKLAIINQHKKKPDYDQTLIIIGMVAALTDQTNNLINKFLTEPI